MPTSDPFLETMVEGYRGQVVFQFKQGRDLVIPGYSQGNKPLYYSFAQKGREKEVSSKIEGLCFAIVASWVGKKHAHLNAPSAQNDYWPWLFDAESPRISALSDLILCQYESDSRDVNVAFAMFGLTPGKPGGQSPLKEDGSLNQALRASPGGKQLMLIGEAVNHATAAYITADGGAYFMDPNFGEFYFPPQANFWAWLLFFLSAKYKRVAGASKSFDGQLCKYLAFEITPMMDTIAAPGTLHKGWAAKFYERLRGKS